MDFSSIKALIANEYSQATTEVHAFVAWLEGKTIEQEAEEKLDATPNEDDGDSIPF